MTTQQFEQYLTGRKISVGNYLYLWKDQTKMRAKITSIKIWKKQKTEEVIQIPRFRIGLKHGLYVFGEITSFHELHTQWLSEFEKSFLA
jgi:hypothetical protein